MTRYHVYFRARPRVSVNVEADDCEAAIEQAYEQLLGDVCPRCSGWGQKWSRGEGNYEPYEVVNDESGETAWAARIEQSGGAS